MREGNFSRNSNNYLSGITGCKSRNYFNGRRKIFPLLSKTFSSWACRKLFLAELVEASRFFSSR